ncbi:MAG: aldehyde dehydrogenase family protein [Gammaproteobacteria bacterium]|nr:aldehyde dehydrogenase family protein [Gammaproteobacteria bacterium]
MRAGEPRTLDAAVQSADSALRSSSWSKANPATRESLLRRLATLIDENIETLAYPQSLDTGMPLSVSRNLDIAGAADVVRYMSGWPTKIAGRTMTFESPGGQPAFGYTRREPVGVVGGIIPWNVPFMLAIWKVAPSLAGRMHHCAEACRRRGASGIVSGRIGPLCGLPAGCRERRHRDRARSRSAAH